MADTVLIPAPRWLLLAAALGLHCGLALPASAVRCSGPYSYQMCVDESGGAVTISHFGRESVVSSQKGDTGESYSQFSTTLGKTTYTDSIDSHGHVHSEITDAPLNSALSDARGDFTDLNPKVLPRPEGEQH